MRMRSAIGLVIFLLFLQIILPGVLSSLSRMFVSMFDFVTTMLAFVQAALMAR